MRGRQTKPVPGPVSQPDAGYGTAVTLLIMLGVLLVLAVVAALFTLIIS